MMVYGPGVSNMYCTIVEGRRRELEAQRTMTDAQISEYIGGFAQEVKYMKRADFNEMYDLYKEMVYGRTGTRRKKQ